MRNKVTEPEGLERYLVNYGDSNKEFQNKKKFACGSVSRSNHIGQRKRFDNFSRMSFGLEYSLRRAGRLLREMNLYFYKPFHLRSVKKNPDDFPPDHALYK